MVLRQALLNRLISVGKCTAVFTTNESARPCSGSSFFNQLMACCHDNLIHLTQNVRRKQADIVLQGLNVITTGAVGPMSQHLAQGAVLIGQFLQTVIITICDQAQCSKDRAISFGANLDRDRNKGVSLAYSNKIFSTLWHLLLED